MIGYITLGTNNMERGARFYDSLLSEIGASRAMETDTFIAWAVSPDKPLISIIKPFDGNPATVGNGSMLALEVGSREEVDRLYHKARELGAADEGEPGMRRENFYGGYFRDMDGHKFIFYCYV